MPEGSMVTIAVANYCKNAKTREFRLHNTTEERLLIDGDMFEEPVFPW
jgi:hypothetical protein